MKTITEVIALFPDTKSEQWHQHENGKGWVFETAFADLTSFVEGLVSGNARVYGDARVFGNAWVYGDARVSGNARVFGNAWVYGDARVSGDALVYGDAWVYGDARVSGNARVSGDAWVSSPLYIQGTRHSMTLCSFTEIAIGCEVHSIVNWKKNYKTIGAKAGYTKTEIKEYGEYIAMLAKAARRFQKASK